MSDESERQVETQRRLNDSGYENLVVSMKVNDGAILPSEVSDAHSADLSAALYARRMREGYQRGELEQSDIERLEAIPGWYWYYNSWEKMRDHLSERMAENGHKLPDETAEGEDFRARMFAIVQRERYAMKTLSPARVAALEAITGWTW